MSEIAISVNNISKMYKLYENPMDRLKESLGLTRKKRYKEHYALNNVSFQVKKGETVGIIGTNGSGKSTILKIITGVLNPTQGEVVVDGRISALLELGAGFNGEYSGIENVYLNGQMIGFSKEEIDAKLQDILDFADIGDFIHQPVKTYSSGMFVRLAFAVAINIEPEILIVDEALSVGDVFFQAKCYRKFEEFKEMGKTILFVSHQMNTIRQLCDRVVVLKEGQVIYDGEVEEGIRLYNSEAYLEKQLHYDYTDLPRYPDFDLKKAQVMSLSVLKNETSIYEANEPIEFRLRIKVKVPDLGDLSFRMMIWHADETPIETAFTKTFANITNVGDYDVEVKINDHHLAPGLYKLTIILSGGDSSANSENLDYVYPAFVFEVLNADGTSKNWSRSWGWVHMDDVDVKLIGEKKE